MRKFTVVSGFLGSGKTTTMMALTDYLNKKNIGAAMISNDLGGKGLADYRLSKASGVRSEEICGECICFVTEELIECLRRLYTGERCEMVLSDIPGFGVGALEHVYYKLRDEYPEECSLGPFTVITEGASLSKLMKDGETQDELNCLLKSQLMEGDLIVLNKIDQYNAKEKAAYREVIRQICPDTPVIMVSAVTGEGIPELAEYLIGNGTAYPEPEFGVTEEEFEAAFGKLSMYNCQYYAEICCDDFDANEYLTALAEEIRAGLAENGCDTPHLKLFAQREDGDFCKIDLLGVNREVIVTHAMKMRCVDLPVVINTTSAAPAAVLGRVIDGAVRKVSGRWNMSVMIYFRECFGLNEEGRDE